MKVINEAVRFSGYQAILGTSQHFFSPELSLKALASVEVQFGSDPSTVIRPNPDLTRRQLELLISEMTKLSPVVDFSLDLSTWRGEYDSRYDNSIDDDLLEAISQMSGSLRTLIFPLRFEYDHQITDNGLSHLSRCSSLQTLKLCACPNVTGDGFKHLSHLMCLESLELYDFRRLTDENLVHLELFIGLKQLRLGHCPRLTSPGFTAIGKLAGLVELEI